MTDSTSTIIRASNLSAGYGHTAIWHEAGFQIEKGEFVGVLGPNGAGKTTLFRLLLGLSRPMSGELEIFNQPPQRGNPRIGYVAQHHSLDYELRLEALTLVRLGINSRSWGFAWPNSARAEWERALAALKMVGAENLAHRRLGQLSGGELQRIFLAQALVGQPDILLLDEPLANLDLRRETELVALVSRVAKAQNVAVMLIAHDINPLLPVVNRLIYIVNGRIATGKPKDIITTKALSKLYGAPVEVLSDSRGRLAVLGTEEVSHHD